MVTEKKRGDLAGMSAGQAAEYAMSHDLGSSFADAEVVRERRPAKVVTALRIDLDVQRELEAAARGAASRYRTSSPT